MQRILIVDDEEDILDLLEYNLANSGFLVDKATLGRVGLSLAGQNTPDLIILDEMLPDLRGFEVLRELKTRTKTKDVPVILLTARIGESDKLMGFTLGADDYLSKPFSVSELLARIRAILRRVKGLDNKRPELLFGDLAIDIDAHRVAKNGVQIELTPQEFRLLAFFATHQNKVFNREQLISNAWGDDVMVDPRTVDVHIRRLRSHIEDDPAKPTRIETVRGSGYRFNPETSKTRNEE